MNASRTVISEKQLQLSSSAHATAAADAGGGDVVTVTSSAVSPASMSSDRFAAASYAFTTIK